VLEFVQLPHRAWSVVGPLGHVLTIAGGVACGIRGRLDRLRNLREKRFDAIVLHEETVRAATAYAPDAPLGRSTPDAA
jgi:hypothetical protein